MAQPLGEDHAVSERLHPVVGRIVFALAVLLVLAIASFADGTDRTGLPLTVAVIFVVVATGLGSIVYRIRRRHRDPVRDDASDDSFSRWLDADLVTYSGRLRGSDALLTLLLPLVAVSGGMAAFAVLLHFIAPGAA